MSCNPMSLNEDDNRRRRTPRDGASGQNDFRLPTTEDIEKHVEEASKTLSIRNCNGYENCFSNPLAFITQDIIRCLCKVIDESLKPTCEMEAGLKDALRNAKNREEEEEIEEQLAAVEDAKYSIAEQIYTTADTFDETNRDFEEDYEIDDDDGTWRKLLKRGVGLAVEVNIGGITQALDSKARTTCVGIDLSRVRKIRR